MDIKTGGYAHIDGRSRWASATLKHTFLWRSLECDHKAAKLGHGTRVRVLDRDYSVKYRADFYRVRSWWRVGWVSGRYLSRLKEKSVGDLV